MIRTTARPQPVSTAVGYDAGVVTGSRPDDPTGARAFSAGHVVAGVHREFPAAELVARIVGEYRAAAVDWRSRLASAR